ncbi:TetR family transcriptional regulator [Pseudohaliea sp.]|uniref:TetR family transcriptional regulator n=1 Tax=Pseudohaliea sp. TaxID=2740289 RepID=UPI0032EE29E4
MAAHLTASELAKRKTILASIRLFSECGVDSVSLRMINRKAGHKNNSALHYHFGSKLGLIGAVDEFIQQHFGEVRQPALEALENRAAEGDITVRDVIDVFVQAYVDIIEHHDWGYDAVRTIARMEFDNNTQVHDLLSQSAGLTVQRFARLTRPLLTDLKPKEYKRRFNFVVNSTIHAFADYQNLNKSYLGDLSVRSLKDLARFQVDMAVAVLCHDI